MKKLFYNGDFITLDKENVEAVLIDCGKIKKVGSKEEVFEEADQDTILVDLNKKTMMPAFLDAHSHFTGVANNLLKANLIDCTNFDQIRERLLQFQQDLAIEEGNWIVACNYDHNQLSEKRHPSKAFLDFLFPNHPVLLQHVSGHMGVFNSKALELLGVNRNTKAEEGGRINFETGYMEETSFVNYQLKVPMPSFENLLKAYQKAQEIYLENGITTVQDGMAYKEMIPLYQALMSENLLKLDLVSYIDIKEKNEFFKNLKKHIKCYQKNLKIGGYKIFLDGSPQGRTAWMRTPYAGSNYYGYGTMSNQEVETAVKVALEDKMQLLAHCNGDAAAEQYIKAFSDKSQIEKIRPVMIHAQLLGIDQLKEVKKYHIIPSFFIAHIYHWGDVHIENFGYERAKVISPVGSALKEKILYTFHQDSPVIAPNMFETIWCAIERKTKSGILLDENEKISVLDAIKGVTIYAAYQYFEETTKGSIQEGKNADLIIASQNPLKVAPDDIKNIRILETIKNGETLFKANERTNF